MADLFKKAQKDAMPPSRLNREIERKRAAVKAFDAQFAALARNTVATSGPVNVLAGNYPTLPPAPEPTRKADPLVDAPAHIQTIAKRVGPEGGKLLALIARRSAEENGAPINFDTAEAASAMSVPQERAERILGHMLQIGILTPRTGPLGNRAGYVITAPGSL